MNFVSSHPAFNDTIDSLKNEFKDDTSNTVVVFGSHNFKFYKFYELKQKYDKVIVFQMEQLNTQKSVIWSSNRTTIDKNYFAWLKSADEVWDYDESNFKVLKLIRPDAQLHLLKPYKDWTIYPPVKKDIDILFYGAMNEHRANILNELKKKYKVVILNCWDSKTIDNYILRSKILLNIHYYYDAACQEQARMIRWIGSPCRIISEKSCKNYLGVEEIEYKEMVNI
jgi:hypothetical protein